jgi:hypothetical protein
MFLLLNLGSWRTFPEELTYEHLLWIRQRPFLKTDFKATPQLRKSNVDFKKIPKSEGGKMKSTKMSLLALTSAAGLALFLLAGFRGAAQDKPKGEVFQAQAMGQSTQMGKTFHVTVHIAEYSSPEERQVLVEAFEKAGSEGLFNALEKMPSKGRIAITGTLGYDISFIRKIPTDGGYKVRVLTNRPIRFGEAWSNGRSVDYNLSALELDISNEKDKNTGVLLPACMFKVDKKTKELVIENYQNPWKLVNILDRSED